MPLTKISANPPAEILPSDQRQRLGGLLFLLSLLVFFLSSILLYGIYAYWRRDDPQRMTALPASFMVSTVCLLAISGLVHFATRSIRRERRTLTGSLLGASALLALIFMAIQFVAMIEMLTGRGMDHGTAKGVVGMVVVLAFLHALHVLGGVFALGLVGIRSIQGRYDHERHWPVDFAAQYWHFLDLIWLCMLGTFWMTTGGF
ncbi:cytochrome c oxidase subunit 3 [Planctomycetes bacterium K23_9]|uniref:Cytochrome c oxidase polypeptide I+III n=1 Tax=Stieleria marina TaxID=1930275 RepID=A0A517NZC1_9BACT|nr:Cytochrome c oxidase polypeptide I+III [Planctomycetes bacterium K23_9]